MKFLLRLNLQLILWSIIFGFISGIFGISVSLIRFADFYLQEGTQQKTETFLYRVANSADKPLTDASITELQNIEGIAFVDPYFSPTNEIIGTINYFGFTASTPVPISGIPKRLGIQKAKRNYQSQWSSSDLNSIAVLLPQQAIILYNNIAPQRGWPNLTEESFIGLPGVKMSIGTNTVNVIISGFDPDEFGTIVTVSAEKLFSIFNNYNLTPYYDYFQLETVPGLTAAQGRNIVKEIENLGYRTEDGNQISFQQGLFLRIRYTLIIFGASILLAFMFLLFYSISNSLLPIRRKIVLYRIWGIRDPIFIQSVFFSIVFSAITGIIAWIICFFAVIPAQDYLINTITQFGINVPALRDSVRISLEIAIFSSSLYLIINIFAILYFYSRTPQASQTKFQ